MAITVFLVYVRMWSAFFDTANSEIKPKRVYFIFCQSTYYKDIITIRGK